MLLHRLVHLHLKLLPQEPGALPAGHLPQSSNSLTSSCQIFTQKKNINKEVALLLEHAEHQDMAANSGLQAMLLVSAKLVAHHLATHHLDEGLT